MFHHSTPIPEGAGKIGILQVEKRINVPLLLYIFVEVVCIYSCNIVELSCKLLILCL